MDAEKLEKTLRLHGMWLRKENGGEQADLIREDLRGSDLRWADLSKVLLYGADLSGASLSGADLSGASLSGAKLTGAKLTGADLSGASLSGASLSGASLHRCTGNGAEVKSLDGGLYRIVYTVDRLFIGCQAHLITDWWGFDDRAILKMDGRRALDWWREWKPRLQQIIADDPATPTGHEEAGNAAA